MLSSDDFKEIRSLYAESQLEFGRRLGFDGQHESIRRKVRRYESGETPIVGTMVALLTLLRASRKRKRVNADTSRRRIIT